MDDRGHVVRRKRLARREWLTCTANVPPLRIGMGAWGRAHDWARCVREQGPEGRVIAPPWGKASVTSPKREARDAEALGEAVTRPTLRVGPSTRVAQQDLQARQRGRERLITARPAWGHEARGLPNASGIVLPHSLATCRALLVDRLEADQAKRTALRPAVFWRLDDACLAVEPRLASDDGKLAALGQAQPACQRPQTLPGIGPVTATALSAALGDVTQAKHGRPLAAWLGWVPREHSTGGQPRVLGMRQRGAGYRRTWSAQGARATPRGVATTPDARRQRLNARMARRGKDRAAVA
jgi:transposase